MADDYRLTGMVNTSYCAGINRTNDNDFKLKPPTPLKLRSRLCSAVSRLTTSRAMVTVSRQELESKITEASSLTSRFTLIYAPPSWPWRSSSLDGSNAGPSSESDTSGDDTTKKTSDSSSIHIAVLDSSFNPPTLAHETIASSSFPPRFTPSHPASLGLTTGIDRDPDQPSDFNSKSADNPYTARLLLFSFRNVDKHLKPHDPSVLQRVEMILLLAKRVGERTGQEVGVGLVDEPTFAGKDGVVREWLERRFAKQPPSASSGDTQVAHSRDGTSDCITERIGSSPATDDFQLEKDLQARHPEVELTFLIGTDTLIRFFDPKYYPPNEMLPILSDFFTRSSIVSSQRGEEATSQGVEIGVLSRPEVKEWVKSGKVRLSGSFKEGREDVSSTRVREAIKHGGGEELLKELVNDDVREYIESEGLYR